MTYQNNLNKNNIESKNKKLNKVARITVYFWIMKVVATTLGEMLGDFFSMTLNLGIYYKPGNHSRISFGRIDSSIKG